MTASSHLGGRDGIDRYAQKSVELHAHDIAMAYVPSIEGPTGMLRTACTDLTDGETLRIPPNALPVLTCLSELVRALNRSES